MRHFVAVIASTVIATSPQRAAAQQAEAAQVLFNAGSEYLQQQRWADGLTVLQQSEAIVPRAATELGVGQALVQLGRNREAVAWLRAASARAAGPDAEDVRRRAAALLTTAYAALATLSLTVSPPSALATVDGQAVETVGGREVVLEPGQHTITVSGPGLVEQRQTVTLAAGSTSHISVSLAQLPNLVLDVFPAEAAVAIDGQPTTNSQGGARRRIGALPGTHVITVTAPDFQPQQISVTLGPGAVTARSVTLLPTAEDTSRPGQTTPRGQVGDHVVAVLNDGAVVPPCWQQEMARIHGHPGGELSVTVIVSTRVRVSASLSALLLPDDATRRLALERVLEHCVEARTRALTFGPVPAGVNDSWVVRYQLLPDGRVFMTQVAGAVPTGSEQ